MFITHKRNERKWQSEVLFKIINAKHPHLLLLLLNLEGDGSGLAKHDNGGTLHDGNAAETFALLEALNDERLARLEDDLSHLIGLQVRGVLGLGATGLLADLPVDLGDTAGRAASAHEGDGGVSDLQLSGVVQDLDGGSEGGASLQGVISLLDHDVTDARHVLLGQVLDVQANVVSGKSLGGRLVVHLNGEDLAEARLGSGVSGEEDALVTGADLTLLDTAGDHISDTLNLVDTRDGHAQRLLDRALGDLDHVLEAVEEGVAVDGLLLGLDVSSLPPGHLFGLGEEVVSHPAGDGHERNAVLDELFLPSDLDEHRGHLVLDLVVALLGVFGGIAVHLVDTNNGLLDTQKVDQTGVLTSLTLDLTGLVVTTSDGGGKVTIGGDHEEGDVGLGSTRNHVLDEISVAGGIDDGVVVRRGVELLGGAGNGHTAGTLFLGLVHVESEGERLLAQDLSFGAKLLHGTLIDTTELENQTTSGGRLTSVDVAADND